MDDDKKIKPRIALARNSAKKLLKESQFKSAPIILNAIVKNLKNKHQIKVYPWNFGKKIHGVQITKGDLIAIGYNSDEHPNKQRFTVAHEIGHFLLGHTHKGQYDFNSKDPQEIEANRFAAELLMPKEMLNNDFHLLDNDPKNLARRYIVSEEAMWIRLLQCNLI